MKRQWLWIAVIWILAATPVSSQDIEKTKDKKVDQLKSLTLSRDESRTHWHYVQLILQTPEGLAQLSPIPGRFHLTGAFTWKGISRRRLSGVNEYHLWLQGFQGATRQKGHRVTLAVTRRISWTRTETPIIQTTFQIVDHRREKFTLPHTVKPFPGHLLPLLQVIVDHHQTVTFMHRTLGTGNISPQAAARGTSPPTEFPQIHWKKTEREVTLEVSGERHHLNQDKVQVIIKGKLKIIGQKEGKSIFYRILLFEGEKKVLETTVTLTR